MMKTIIIILSLLLSISGFGQTVITKSNISSGGGTATAGTTRIVFTVGEVAVNETTQGTVHISEGFINPEFANETGLSDYRQNELNVSVFPNPAKDFVNVKFPDAKSYEIDLYSADGKIISTYTTNSTIEQIPVNNLSSGEYLMIVKNTSEKTFKTFNLIKN